MTDTAFTTLLLNEIKDTIEEIGLNSTLKVLKDARMKAVTLEDPNVDFVLRTVGEEMSMSIPEIIDSNKRTDERKIAISVSCYILIHVFNYQHNSLINAFKKTKMAISRYYKNVTIAKMSKSDKYSFDKRVIECYRKVLPIVNQYKKQTLNK